MKRTWLAGLMVAVGLFAAGGSPAAAQTKIGYINSQRILAEAPGTAEVEKQLQSQLQQGQAELQKLETELDSLQAAFGRQQATLSATAKQQRQQELQQKFAAYQQRRGELEQLVQRRQQELVAPIMKRISEMIEQIRKEGNYAMIFDAAAGGLITADTTLDLTGRVLERLKAAPAGNGK